MRGPFALPQAPGRRAQPIGHGLMLAAHAGARGRRRCLDGDDEEFARGSLWAGSGTVGRTLHVNPSGVSECGGSRPPPLA